MGEIKLHQRRVRKGACTYVAIAIYNAAMIFSHYQTSAARTAHRGSGRVKQGFCGEMKIGIEILCGIYYTKNVN
ncbi:MAG: hypothetical protein IIU98_07425, partial [Ruminococcus sp.]|nr:hypothetical protein [Ruminococcus sp.]